MSIGLNVVNFKIFTPANIASASFIFLGSLNEVGRLSPCCKLAPFIFNHGSANLACPICYSSREYVLVLLTLDALLIRQNLLECCCWILLFDLALLLMSEDTRSIIGSWAFFVWPKSLDEQVLVHSAVVELGRSYSWEICNQQQLWTNFHPQAYSSIKRIDR